MKSMPKPNYFQRPTSQVVHLVHVNLEEDTWNVKQRGCSCSLAVASRSVRGNVSRRSGSLAVAARTGSTVKSSRSLGYYVKCQDQTQMSRVH